MCRYYNISASVLENIVVMKLVMYVRMSGANEAFDYRSACTGLIFVQTNVWLVLVYVRSFLREFRRDGCFSALRRDWLN
jgi:hypothetical protein